MASKIVCFRTLFLVFVYYSATVSGQGGSSSVCNAIELRFLALGCASKPEQLLTVFRCNSLARLLTMFSCTLPCVGKGRHCFDSDAECDPERPRRLCPRGQKCCVSEGRCEAMAAGNVCEFNKTVCTDAGRDILPAECPEADQVCCEPVPCSETCFAADTTCDDTGEFCPSGQKCCVNHGPCVVEAGFTCETNAADCNTSEGDFLLPNTCPVEGQACCYPAGTASCTFTRASRTRGNESLAERCPGRISTLEECEMKCLETPGCVNTDYVQNSMRCFLYKIRPAETTPARRFTFSSLQCS